MLCVSFSNLKAVGWVTEAASLENSQDLLSAGSWKDTCASNQSLWPIRGDEATKQAMSVGLAKRSTTLPGRGPDLLLLLPATITRVTK